MNPNRARINKTVEICMELFFRTIITTSCWLYTWELYNSSNKFAANLIFLVTMYTALDCFTLYLITLEIENELRGYI